MLTLNKRLQINDVLANKGLAKIGNPHSTGFCSATTFFGSKENRL